MRILCTSLCCFVLLCLVACKKDNRLFQLLDAKQTGITFNNTITESDTLNILNTEFIYNGGGVGIGDLNGDGLQDVFFTGNQVDNRLYLNRGQMQFEDITAKAGLQKKNPDQWSSGIVLIDINLDGKQDIYVCNTFREDAALRRNCLYVNQGNDASGCPTFKEMAQAYGLDSDSHSPNAQFFDYDNDGDLDVFLSVNYMDRKNPNAFRNKSADGSDPNCDLLLRNDWSDSLGHPVFTDVSKSAGLIWDGYSHSALVTDFNMDGWLDIYVANDYVTNDLIYINNQNGTFSNKIATIFKHQAGSAMGSDIADLNNDGQLDIFTTEMLPYYNKRKKLFLGPNNYAVYVNNEKYGYEYQYSRNVLQLNRGISPETGLPVFSDVAFMTGTQETEWSWTPLLADFDNDGNRDIFITNGFPRDVTDHDFNTYHSEVGNLVSPMDLQGRIPQIKVPKFLFRNDGDLHFSDQSKAWGLDVPAFSNGAAYGDLDNDGDLDLVVNNINDPAFIFKNTLNDQKETAGKNNYLRLKIAGKQPNAIAFGAEATVYFDGKQQKAQVLAARGYNSASEAVLHFGLGSATQVDSVVVRWPGNQSVTLPSVAANQTLAVPYRSAQQGKPFAFSPGLFEAANAQAIGLEHMPLEYDYVDFDYQRTMPHKFSQYGPGIAVGDVNGDDLDDVYVGGSAGDTGAWFWQTPEGKFVKKAANFKTDSLKYEEDMGLLLFDADGDGDNDLYITRGGAAEKPGSPLYQDILCINNGKGAFTVSKTALPQETANGGCVKAADFDGDGDLDLFVGGSVRPRTFPQCDRSFLLRNDSKGKDQPLFTDVTQAICPSLEKPGLVTDALWTDFDNDGRPDLMLAGEWMPLSFFKNEGAHFKNMTDQTGLSDQTGWWTSLSAADFDNDGDIDYIAGNYGQNTYFQCHTAEPLTLYAKDFDNNTWLDPFISCYWKDSLGNKQEYFYHSRDDMVKQLITIRRKFYGYGDFGTATARQVFKPDELKDAIILKTNNMSSSFVENLGNGKFKMTDLPREAQIAPVFGTMPYDIDQDGLLDVLLVGNDFGMELLQGRADAMNGLVLKNMGNHQFKAIELNESHFFVPRDGKALAQLGTATGQTLILATQNWGALKAFVPKATNEKRVRLAPNEAYAILYFKNGQKRKQPFTWGSTFLSQDSRSMVIGQNVEKVAFFDQKNNLMRKIGY